MNQGKNNRGAPSAAQLSPSPALTVRTAVRAGGAFNCQPPSCRGCISAEAHQDCRAAARPPYAA